MSLFRALAFVAFALAALLAFVAHYTAAHIALLFILGVISTGLALLSLDGWKPGP